MGKRGIEGGLAIAPDRLYRWPGGAAAVTGLGEHSLRQLRRAEAFHCVTFRRLKFVSGQTLIGCLLEMGVLESNGQNEAGLDP